jgi:hypothetical protein
VVVCLDPNRLDVPASFVTLNPFREILVLKSQTESKSQIVFHKFGCGRIQQDVVSYPAMSVQFLFLEVRQNALRPSQ